MKQTCADLTVMFVKIRSFLILILFLVNFTAAGCKIILVEECYCNV